MAPVPESPAMRAVREASKRRAQAGTYAQLAPMMANELDAIGGAIVLALLSLNAMNRGALTAEAVELLNERIATLEMLATHVAETRYSLGE